VVFGHRLIVESLLKKLRVYSSGNKKRRRVEQKQEQREPVAELPMSKHDASVGQQ